MKEWFARWGGWLLLFVLAAAYYPSFGKGLDSVALYAEAGRCMLRAQELLPCVPMFSYQPALAVLMIPFVFIPTVLHKLVWYVVCIGSLVIVVRIAEAMAERLYPGVTRGNSGLWLRGICLFLSSKHILDCLNYQVYELPALAIMMTGLWSLTVGREASGGFLLAVAAAIRATPLIFLPYLVVRLRYVALAAMVVGFTAVSLLPDAIGLLNGGHIGFLGDWIHQVATPMIKPGSTSDVAFWSAWNGTNLNNQSIRGLVNRFTDGPVMGFSPGMIVLALYAVVGLVLAVVFLKSPRTKEYAPIDGCVLLIAMLALSPMTSRYHYIFILPAYFLVVAAAMADRRTRIFAGAAAALCFVLVTGTSNDLVGRRMTELAYLYGFMTLGAMFLFAALAALLLVWRPPAITAAQQEKPRAP